MKIIMFILGLLYASLLAIIAFSIYFGVLIALGAMSYSHYQKTGSSSFAFTAFLLWLVSGVILILPMKIRIPVVRLLNRVQNAPLLSPPTKKFFCKPFTFLHRR